MPGRWAVPVFAVLVVASTASGCTGHGRAVASGGPACPPPVFQLDQPRNGWSAATGHRVSLTAAWSAAAPDLMSITVVITRPDTESGSPFDVAGPDVLGRAALDLTGGSGTATVTTDEAVGNAAVLPVLAIEDYLVSCRGSIEAGQAADPAGFIRVQGRNSCPVHLLPSRSDVHAAATYLGRRNAGHVVDCTVSPRPAETFAVVGRTPADVRRIARLTHSNPHVRTVGATVSLLELGSVAALLESSGIRGHVAVDVARNLVEVRVVTNDVTTRRRIVHLLLASRSRRVRHAIAAIRDSGEGVGRLFQVSQNR